MTRRSWTARRRLALFEAHGGKCHLCDCKIGVGEAWDVEHIIPVGLGGDDDEGNCAPAHKACHKAKTKTDKGTMAKANRVRAKHKGATVSKNPLPGSKNSKWKRKIGGGWVPRE